HHLKHLKKWTSTRRASTPLVLFPSKSRVRREAYGLVLIMAPWYYPLGLLLTPLVGAIAAGNCVVLKPANYAKATSSLLEQLIRETFPQEYISIFTGGRDVNAILLDQQYDYMFFTGGSILGKIVAESAAKNFTPLTLELGGKSPCIVDKDANLGKAARRIVWGKFLNLGQTCIAPDHLYVHSAIKNKLVELMAKEIKRQFGNDPQKSPDLSRIINENAFDRICAYMENTNILIGGKKDKADKYISPTLIDGVDDSMPVMQDEIFGPILPLIEFDKIDDVIEKASQKDKPLAMYYFTKSKKKAKHLMFNVNSGSVCINDVVIQFANNHIPFGGVGNSGMGSYHGRYNINTFSRERSVVTTPTLFDIPVKFAPYGKKLKLLKKIL
ncbi:MAG: aldehyde dehydrogenase family protein, partial [Candidatus Marinimicrobia bacterium]|nr:aldehyde dehydrogenase family protein [Candidatus Neomarinimicrobiota bacterium]